MSFPKKNTTFCKIFYSFEAFNMLQSFYIAIIYSIKVAFFLEDFF